MKPEEMAKKCPKCGCQDKNRSQIRKGEGDDTIFFIPHVPKNGVEVIRCNECGHIFEYCEECKPVLEVKKKVI